MLTLTIWRPTQSTVMYVRQAAASERSRQSHVDLIEAWKSALPAGVADRFCRQAYDNATVWYPYRW